MKQNGTTYKKVWIQEGESTYPYGIFPRQDIGISSGHPVLHLVVL